MKQLVKKMYGDIFRRGSNLFGLKSGQTRESPVIQMGHWYNQDGEYLGFGDLDELDIRTIQRGLNADEIFIVLEENAGEKVEPHQLDWQARFVIGHGEILRC